MAPAIAHFLIGATILLASAIPIILRYDVDREAAIWVIPVGGVWGIAPDFHHVAPIGSEALRSLHASPWVEVFALHYTLDRPAIRAQYHASVFWAIAVFTVAIGGVWIAGRVHDAEWRIGTSDEWPGAVVVVGTSLLAGGFATLIAGTVFSIQGMIWEGLSLVGATGPVAGGLIVGLVGVGGGLGWGLAAELAYTRVGDCGIGSAAAGGAGGGVLAWAGVVGVALVFGFTVPLWGSLVGCIAYGVVFGVVYVVVRDAFG